jgi:hypothetical protein
MTMADHVAILLDLKTGKESPQEHVRTALLLLSAFQLSHPAVWRFSPDLHAAERRLWKAVWMLENRKDGTHE